MLGVATIAAPVLLLTSTVAFATGGGLGEDDAGGVLQVYAMAALMLAVVALAQLIEDALPRATALLIVTGAIGTAGGVAYGIDSIYGELGSFTLDDDVEGAVTGLGLQLPGALFPATFAGFGIALVRSRVAPAWCGIVLTAAAVCFPLSRIPSVEALALAVDVGFLAALAPLGARMLRDPERRTAGEAAVGAQQGG